jgi:hypothetical protein
LERPSLLLWPPPERQVEEREGEKWDGNKDGNQIEEMRMELPSVEEKKMMTPGRKETEEKDEQISPRTYA